MPARSIASTAHSDYIKEHNQHVVKPPTFTSRSVKRYFKTRIPSLFVSREELSQYPKSEIFNPFGVLNQMSLSNWNYFFMGFWGWTWDAFDFFAVSLNAHAMAETFEKSVKDITWGITLVLMLRSIGALVFGYWGDRYGRKWPYIVNLSLLVVLQIGTGFVKTYEQFLGVRALFGIAMGGVYGFSLATSLDDAPAQCRGILSGIFQEGYAFGYLLAVIFNRAIVPNSSHGWRAIFWFAAGPPVLFVIWRWYLPETQAFQRQLEKQELERSQEPGNKFFSVSKSAKEAINRYWLIMIYCVLMMAGFNFMSHGSQDLYPTLLTAQLDYSADRSTVTNSVANLGAIFGGMVCGHFSTFIGRRLTIILACILGGAMVYPWAFSRSSAINAGAFFLQAGVQGAWGVVPIHLSELSPPAYRSLVVGLSYQLGNLASSASSTIESTIGERFPITLKNGKKGYDYSKVMAIFIGAVFAYMILIILLGPENRGADFNMDRDVVLVDEDEELMDKKEDEGSLGKGGAVHYEGGNEPEQR
ncbi:CIC11C00000002800 [Sungouiella intermedia]|uniref:CIC11C00000002800 n=1 Tax=Sungouiella intermedia TaxID=45354 RepID=A0A1L0BE23_9ASCO|nr:CIC11C00000002800 [[Candida] intermedia]